MASKRLTADDLRALLGGRRQATASATARVEADCVVADPVPGRAIATSAGYAVASEDVVGAAPTSPVMLRRVPVRVRIGDPLPDGCDAVVDPETVETAGGIAMAHAETVAGTGVRRPGQDVGAGSVLARAGMMADRRLRAVLAAAGLAPGARLPDWMDAPVDAPPDPVTAGAIARLMENVVPDPGVRLTLSADPASDAARPRVGERCVADRVALHPAERTAVMAGPSGMRVILPARLDAALALAFLFGPAADARGAEAPLSRKVVSAPGVDEMALVILEDHLFRPLAIGDWPLSAIARASHILLVPADSEGYPAGAVISAVPIGAL